MLDTFLQQFYPSAKHTEVYQFMRLLMPSLDRQRANYGLKETAIAQIYNNVLLLPQNEKERLKHWKNPTKQPIGSPTGDFVGVLVHVLQNRCRGESKLDIT